MNTIQNMPERTKHTMMGALFHGYSTPACSKAKTRSMEATREENAPM
jgi:hypothetical protein